MTIPKGRKFTILFIGVITCAIAFLLLSKGSDGFAIVIQNDTQFDVTGLRVSYEHITKDIEIQDIKAGANYRLIVNPTETFNENHNTLYYRDKNGTIQSETLIGYFEKGYSGKVNVWIRSVIDEGVFNIEVKQDI